MIVTGCRSSQPRGSEWHVDPVVLGNGDLDLVRRVPMEISRGQALGLGRGVLARAREYPMRSSPFLPWTDGVEGPGHASPKFGRERHLPDQEVVAQIRLSDWLSMGRRFEERVSLCQQAGGNGA